MLRVMQLTLSRLVRAGETTQPTQVWTGREICGLMATVGLGPEKMIEQSVSSWLFPLLFELHFFSTNFHHSFVSRI
ncbi:unnamed protein product [Trichobilharzia regenti]|nr:unnamed protein product [Trichobilharzia regenti]